MIITSLASFESSTVFTSFCGHIYDANQSVWRSAQQKRQMLDDFIFVVDAVCVCVGKWIRWDWTE